MKFMYASYNDVLTKYAKYNEMIHIRKLHALQVEILRRLKNGI